MPVTELYAFNLTCVILLMALYGVALRQNHSNHLKKGKIYAKYKSIEKQLTFSLINDGPIIIKV